VYWRDYSAVVPDMFSVLNARALNALCSC